MIATEEQTRALVDMLSEALDDISDLREDIENKQRADRENDAWRKWASLLCGGARNKGIAHESDPENVRSMSLVGMGLFGAVDELKILRADVGEVLGLAGYDSLDELLADLREGCSVVRAGYCDEQYAERTRLQKEEEDWLCAAAKVNDYAFAKDLGTTPHKMMTQGMLREAGAEMYRKLQDWRAVAQHVCKGEVTPEALHKAISHLQNVSDLNDARVADIERIADHLCVGHEPLIHVTVERIERRLCHETAATWATERWRQAGAWIIHLAYAHPINARAATPDMAERAADALFTRGGAALRYPPPAISITCTGTLDEVTP